MSQRLGEPRFSGLETVKRGRRGSPKYSRPEAFLGVRKRPSPRFRLGSGALRPVSDMEIPALCAVFFGLPREAPFPRSCAAALFCFHCGTRIPFSSGTLFCLPDPATFFHSGRRFSLARSWVRIWRTSGTSRGPPRSQNLPVWKVSLRAKFPSGTLVRSRRRNLGGLKLTSSMPRPKALHHGAGDDARIKPFGVADLAGFVDRLAADAKVGDGRDIPGRNIPSHLSAVPLNLPPLLRRVVFVGEPALSHRLNLKGVGLGAVRKQANRARQDHARRLWR